MNGKKVDIPSYRVSPNDIVEVRNKSPRDDAVRRRARRGRRARGAAWLEVIPSHSACSCTLPKREQIDTQVQEQLIVELYSK